MRDLFSELKRRNVFRVAVAYIVLSWLLLQVGDVLFDTLELPSAWNKGLLAILALGLAPALIFSWVYELTPEGVKKESEIDPAQSVTAHTARKLDLAVIVLLVMAMGLYAAGRFLPESPQPVAEQSTPPSPAVPEPQPEEPTPLNHGVAVLPFENMSEDAANAFFAGGVHEDVLTHLSRIPDLRVISRTSMLRVAEAGLDIRGIAERLGVSHVLEGTVRRAGDRVRVTVQLIDGRNDEHLWAENYDRTLTDIFAIQSEIALAIAEQLQAELSPETLEDLWNVPTRNAEAYDLLLKGRALIAAWEGTPEERFGQIISLTEQAVALDPDFLQAWGLLAYAHGRMVWFVRDPDGQHAARAREVVDHIQSRWPLEPESLVAMGDFLYTVEYDFPGAFKAYAGAQLQRPNDLHVLSQMAYTLKRLGRFEEMQLYCEKALELDPESAVIGLELALALQLQGKLDQALAQYERLRDRFPDNFNAQDAWAESRLSILGDRQPVLDLAKRRLETEDRVYYGQTRTWWLAGAGDLDGANRLIQLRRERTEDWYEALVLSMDVALVLRLQGDETQAQAAADRGLELLLSNEPEGGFQSRFQIGLGAYAAAVAGNDELHRGFMDQWESVQSLDQFDEMGGLANLALSVAYRGDPAAGWELLDPTLGKPGFLTPTTLAGFREFYAHFFGDLPEFQAFLAEARVVQ